MFKSFADFQLKQFNNYIFAPIVIALAFENIYSKAHHCVSEKLYLSGCRADYSWNICPDIIIGALISGSYGSQKF